MANLITPNGYNRSRDILGEASLQDAERRARSEQDHYDRTGERLPPIVPNDPLVYINGSAPTNIANDGDTYSDLGGSIFGEGMANGSANGSSGTFSQGRYVEDNPTRPIRNSPFSEEVLRQEEDRIAANREAQSKDPKEDEKFRKAMKEARKKYNNALSGLEIEDDEE